MRLVGRNSLLFLQQQKEQLNGGGGGHLAREETVGWMRTNYHRCRFPNKEPLNGWRVASNWVFSPLPPFFVVFIQGGGTSLGCRGQKTAQGADAGIFSAGLLPASCFNNRLLASHRLLPLRCRCCCRPLHPCRSRPLRRLLLLLARQWPVLRRPLLLRCLRGRHLRRCRRRVPLYFGISGYGE